MTGCFLRVSPDAIAPALNLGGSGVAFVSVPNLPSLLGGRLFLQAFVPDANANPLGATLTNGVGLTVGL